MSSCTEGKKEVALKFADCPAAVQKTIMDHASGIQFPEVEKETKKDGRVVYEAKGKKADGQKIEIKVAADGHLLEFKTKDIDTSAATSGYFLDPWGRHYHFRLDVNYANVVNYPFAVQLPQTLITTGFLIWSVGPDGQYDQIDVVVSPSPLVVTSSQKNKDNVKSW